MTRVTDDTTAAEQQAILLQGLACSTETDFRATDSRSPRTHEHQRLGDVVLVVVKPNGRR